MATKSIPAWILLGPVLAFGQTKVDLSSQGKNVDFSNQTLVRPFRTGSTLPATCLTGEMFFNNTAAPGANSYGCVAPNSWAPQSQPTVQTVRTSSTVLTIGWDCTPMAPCKVRNGSVVHTFASPATVTLQSGSGLALIYINGSGGITVGTPAGITGITCTGCQSVPLVTQFPLDSIPLETWSATANAWDATGTDVRSSLSVGRTFIAGANIALTQAGNDVVISAFGSTGGGGGGSGGSGGSGGTSPTDLTVFDRSHVFAEFGYNVGAPWTFMGACSGSQGTAGVAGEVGALGWSSTSNPCFVYYPGGQGSAFPFQDFLSGPTPNAFILEGRYARSAGSAVGTGDHYIGWSAAHDGTVATFVGVRYSNSASQWQCVIRDSGTDVVAQVIGIPPDAIMHTFTISSDGTPSSVTCKIDATAVTVTGTIPPSSWFASMGSTIVSGTSFFTTLEARIHIAGIAR